MKYLILLFIPFFVFAKEETKEAKLRTLINQELKTLNQIRNKSFNLRYRELELYSELLKVTHAEENTVFIENPTKFKQKKQFFSKTKGFYRKALSLGTQILKRYKNKAARSKVYYTLALNSRDFGNDKKEYSYLRRALALAPKQHLFRYPIQVSMAEYYYNNKQYHKAVKKYSRIISNSNDEWHTKNLLNYAWCLFKTQKFSRSIQMMEDTFILSKEKRYINVAEQAMQALITFYVFDKSFERGTKFITENSDEVDYHLFKFAKKASRKGFYTEANNLLISLIQTSPESKHFIDYHIFALGMYHQYQKRTSFHDFSLVFRKLPTSKEQKEEVIDQLKTVISENQLFLKKDFDISNQTYDKTRLSQTISYFDTISLLNKDTKAENEYFKAETYYSVARYEASLQSYKFVLNTEKPAGTYTHKSMLAVYSILNMSVGGLELDKELDYAYTKHLSLWPKSQKANEIYPRLMSLQLKQGKTETSYKTLLSYKTNYPKEIKEQKELFKSILAKLIKAKAADKLATYINKGKQARFLTDNKFISKTETILASILFEKLDKESSHQKGFEGYTAIYHREQYPKSVRAEAAFLGALRQYKLKNYTENLKWLTRAFQFFSKKEKSTKRNTINSLAIETAYKQQFLASEKLQIFILENFCSTKKKNLNNYIGLIDSNLANDYSGKALYNLKKYSRCIPSIPTKIYEQIAEHLYLFNHDKSYLQFIKKHNSKLTKLNIIISDNLIRKTWEKYHLEEDYSPYLSTLKVYSKDKYTDINATLRQITVFQKQASSFTKSQIAPKDKEGIEGFMARIEQRLNSFSLLREKKDSLLSKKDPHLSYFSTKAFSKAVNELASEFQGYKVKGDKELEVQFYSQMQTLAQNFKSLASQELSQLKKGLESSEVQIPTDNKKTLQLYTFDLNQVSSL